MRQVKEKKAGESRVGGREVRWGKRSRRAVLDSLGVKPSLGHRENLAPCRGWPAAKGQPRGGQERPRNGQDDGRRQKPRGAVKLSCSSCGSRVVGPTAVVWGYAERRVTAAYLV